MMHPAPEQLAFGIHVPAIAQPALPLEELADVEPEEEEKEE